jgi:hypothetical protein
MTEYCYMKFIHTKFNQNATVCNGIIHKKVLKSKQLTVHHSYTLMLPHIHTHSYPTVLLKCRNKMTRICVCVCMWPAINGLSDSSDLSVSLYHTQAANQTNRAHWL